MAWGTKSYRDMQFLNGNDSRERESNVFGVYVCERSEAGQRKEETKGVATPSVMSGSARKRKQCTP
jgi:hypothetical protein